MLAILLLEHNVCHVQIGHVQIVHLDERAVREILNLVIGMASLHCGQQSVLVALVVVYLA